MRCPFIIIKPLKMMEKKQHDLLFAHDYKKFFFFCKKKNLIWKKKKNLIIVAVGEENCIWPLW